MKPLILLTGPEGSGKTTLALNLKRKLEGRGYRVKVVRIRGTHTLAFLIAMFLKRVFRFHGEQLHYYEVWIPRRLERFWILIEFLSVIPLILLYYHLYRICCVVISERSLMDLVVWVLGGLGSKTAIVRSFIFRAILIFTLKYKPIYITASVSELVKRKSHEKDLILKLLPYYEGLRKTLGLKCIDTSTHTVHECLTFLLGFEAVN